MIVTRGFAWGYLPFGFVLSVTDAWLSIQSIAGALGGSAFDYVAASVLGLFLTGFAVFLPALRHAFRSALWGPLWLLFTVADMGTSVLGGIWYGAMDKPFIEPIDFSRINYVPANWQNTLLYVTFVILVQAACVTFGYAILTLSQGINEAGAGQKP